MTFPPLAQRVSGLMPKLMRENSCNTLSLGVVVLATTVLIFSQPVECSRCLLARVKRCKKEQKTMIKQYKRCKNNEYKNIRFVGFSMFYSYVVGVLLNIWNTCGILRYIEVKPLLRKTFAKKKYLATSFDIQTDSQHDCTSKSGFYLMLTLILQWIV